MLSATVISPSETPREAPIGTGIASLIEDTPGSDAQAQTTAQYVDTPTIKRLQL